jgi:hypothetical protein
MYAPGAPNGSWFLGDFDYSGFVDDDDVTLLGVFYDPSAQPLTGSPEGESGSVSISVAAIPEPRGLTLLLIGGGAFLSAAGVCSRRSCARQRSAARR